jgi:pimeloyl-ACP methyl ester carboxylesterase
MTSFRSFDGVEIETYEWGKPGKLPPVVLHHGFAASAQANWEAPGVVDALVSAGRHVYALDARGHGASGKPHDPVQYGETIMARDLRRFIDEIGAREVHLAGYSMGGIVALVAGTEDKRISRLIAGGIGGGVVNLVKDPRVQSMGAIADGLMAATSAGLSPMAAMFRTFAEGTGSDLLALAAQARAGLRTPIALETITAKTLVLAGDSDMLATQPEVLAAAIPGAEVKVIAGDHMRVVGTAAFRSAIVAFFA